MSLTLKSSVTIVLVLAFAGTASADDYHYRNFVIGDRASGMGGAYTAVSDDVSGLFYNPAGIMYSTGTNLSASVNTYYDQSKKYSGVIGGREWKRDSTALLPNFFGVIQPVRKYKIGLSYAVPDSANEDQDQTFYGISSSVQSYTVNFNNSDNTYLFGPSIAAELSKDFSVGMTLYFQERRSQTILNQLVQHTAGYEWTNTYYESNENGLRPVLGVLWSPASKLAVGVSVAKTLIYESGTTYQFTCSDTVIDGSGCDKDIYRLDQFSDKKRKYPLQTGLGLAYFPSSALILSLDVSNNAKVTDENFGDKEAVMNVAVGSEYYLNKNWAVRGGLFTNLSSAPAFQLGVTSDAEERTDIYGVSLSASHFTQNASVTLGTTITSGKGKAQITTDTTTQDVKVFGWMINLSSSYSF